LILLAAAALKAIGGASPIAVPLSLEPLILVEIAAAAALAFHQCKRWCRWAVAGLVARFAVSALWSVIAGQDCCGCFGAARVWPGWVVGGDLFATGWLVGASLIGVGAGVNHELTGAMEIPRLGLSLRAGV
jgi:hypothetical protein